MKIKLMRNLGDNHPLGNLAENGVYEMPDEAAERLIAEKLAEPCDDAQGPRIRAVDRVIDPAAVPDFPELVRCILVEEMGHTREDAERLVKAYPDVVVNGIMGWNVRACAIALEMADDPFLSEPQDTRRRPIAEANDASQQRPDESASAGGQFG